ncbi:MAG: NAD-dependent epimerase/dehydratase family protein [Pyrinomonadaceae bacterium]|nr:NAD-dependent epimerase/dehydratase family protein [Pyrinomonadaceae bacterium]
MKILVTGARGYVGSQLVAYLEKARHQVVPLFRSSRGVKNTGITIDLSDPAARLLKFDEVDAIIHCAGAAHKPFGTPDSVFQAGNVAAAANLAKAAVISNIKRVIMVSTVSVYGNKSYGSAIDEAWDLNATDSYGGSKRRGEAAVAEILRESETDLIVVRPATVVGPNAPGNVQKLIMLLKKNRFVNIGNGSNVKSFVHIDDLCGALEVIATGDKKISAVFNVSAPPISVKQVVATICDELERSVPRVHLPGRLVSVITRAAASITRIKRVRHLAESTSTWLRHDSFTSKYLDSVYTLKYSAEEGIRDQVREILTRQ